MLEKLKIQMASCRILVSLASTLKLVGHGYRVCIAGMRDMGGSQNYGPFLGTLNIRCRIIIGIQKGTIILTTTHIQA